MVSMVGRPGRIRVCFAIILMIILIFIFKHVLSFIFTVAGNHGGCLTLGGGGGAQTLIINDRRGSDSKSESFIMVKTQIVYITRQNVQSK